MPLRLDLLLPRRAPRFSRHYRAGPLQCLVPWRAHPRVAFLFRRQDHRHGLWVDQNQLAELGRRGTIPIGVKVYTASPRWL